MMEKIIHLNLGGIISALALIIFYLWHRNWQLHRHQSIVVGSNPEVDPEYKGNSHRLKKVKDWKNFSPLPNE